jgi:hypothetical protein
MILLLLRRQINTPMTLNIDRQLRILIIRHAGLLNQMNIDNPLLARIPFHEEAKLEMLGAPLVRLFCAGKEAVPGLPRPAVLAVRGDLGRLAEEFLAARVGADFLRGFVEVGGFGVGAEDVAEEEVCYAALSKTKTSVPRLCRM